MNSIDSVPDSSDLSVWHKVSVDVAIRACHSYGVSQAWVQAVANCTLGIVAVESKFGRSPRYHLKCALRRLLSHSESLKRFAPRSQGVAQIDQDRAEYLAHDAALTSDLDVWSFDGAIEATTLGLAKAISLHYATRRHSPSQAEMSIVLITHNAGWMAPRVARLQESLVKLHFLRPETQRSGFVGPMTLSALDSAADLFDCLTLSEDLRAKGLVVPPARGLTHPDLFPVAMRSDLFRMLHLAALQVGEDLEVPRFPEYRFRRWHTGWISSFGYARAVLAHSEDWRKKSTTSLGGSYNSNAK